MKQCWKNNKVIPIIDKYKWEGTKKDDWKKSEKNNKTTALKVLNAKKWKMALSCTKKIYQHC